MPKTYQFTEEQIAELQSAAKKNKNKNVNKRLEALLLRGQGMKRAVVAEKMGFSESHIIQLISDYQHKGIGAIVENHYPGNWCYKGVRPTVPCHHIREYWYAYGTVEPLTGESFFLILPYSNTIYMNLYLENLSQVYSSDQIILACYGAAWL